MTAPDVPFDAGGNVVASRSVARGAEFDVANADQNPRTIKAQVRFSF